MIPLQIKRSWTRLRLLLAVAVFGLLLMTNVLPVSQAAPLTAPALISPADSASLESLGATLAWQQPQGTTQFHIQVTPAKSPATGEPDGPGINLIIGDAASVAKASFLAPEPVFGQGPYVMLPGMTYTWRVRVSDAKTSIGTDDPSWSPWSEERAFHTRAASSGTISLSSPTEGLIPTTLPAVVWKDSDSAIFYYEVQLSADPQFRTGSDGIASVFSNLVHSGESLPPRSWTVPRSFALPPGHFYWRVRPRIQGDGTPVGWRTTFSCPARDRIRKPSPSPRRSSAS